VHLNDPIWLDDWCSDDHRTKIVFITRDLPKETIEAFFNFWQSAGNQLTGLA
jgi:hypothetical protein